MAENEALGIGEPDFFNVRVMQKNLVYIVGISQKYSEECILRRQEYFGQFGSIKKIIINKRGSTNEITSCAYITYSSELEAKKCIQEVDESVLDSKMLRCTYGTTKYCSFFLKNIPCQNADCMYLHEMRPLRDILTKDELVHIRHKLHNFENKNKNVERIGKKPRFDFLDELLQYKSHRDFKPPKKIMFEPIDFDEL